MFLLYISLFLNKPLQYIGIENDKTIYKYIHVQLQLQRNRNGHRDYPGAHTPSFMTFIILHNFKRSDFFVTVKFKNIWPISKVTWDEVLTVLLKVSTF